ncbi:MAG: hypothetical protein C0615_11155, partial [Desulfuromonas sp.]
LLLLLLMTDQPCGTTLPVSLLKEPMSFLNIPTQLNGTRTNRDFPMAIPLTFWLVVSRAVGVSPFMSRIKLLMVLILLIMATRIQASFPQT